MVMKKLTISEPLSNSDTPAAKRDPTLGELIAAVDSGIILPSAGTVFRTPGPSSTELNRIAKKIRRTKIEGKKRAKQDLIDAGVEFMKMPLEERLKRTALYDMVLMLKVITTHKQVEEDEFAEIEELAELEEMGSGGWS